MVLHESVIDDTLGHGGINIHCRLHGHVFLEAHELILVYTLLCGSRAVIFRIGLDSHGAGTYNSILVVVVFEERHGKLLQVDLVGERPAMNHLGLLVTIMVGEGVVGHEGRCELPIGCFIPLDPFKHDMLSNLVKSRSESGILYEDCL